jgi:tetratricopeptide (TPR) repeat protein
MAESLARLVSIYYWWHTALLASIGKTQDAIEILDVAIRHFSRKNIATRTDLAMLQVMDERYDDAEETLSSTLDFASAANPLVACSFAVLYEAQNRLHDAVAATNAWAHRLYAIPDLANLSSSEVLLRADWDGHLRHAGLNLRPGQTH